MRYVSADAFPGWLMGIVLGHDCAHEEIARPESADRRPKSLKLWKPYTGSDYAPEVRPRRISGGADMYDSIIQAIGVRRSRRNLIRIGAIAASAMLASAKTKPADAAGGNGQGDNGQLGCFLRGTRIGTADGATGEWRALP
jgi:hypothetical protein